MDREQARANQKSLRVRYLADPPSATTPLRATARFDEHETACTVDSWAGPIRAGLHLATGGDGSEACSGDMLLQALLGCAGVTFRSVAAAMRLELGEVELVAESSFDARGTLGIDRSVDVGIAPAVVTITVDADLDEQTRERLAASTERYCVVGQSLVHQPTVVVRSRAVNAPAGGV